MSNVRLLLKTKYGLAPDEPTDVQMLLILADVKRFVEASRRDPTENELGAIVQRRCPSYGTNKYGAEVSVELRQALRALRAK